MKAGWQLKSIGEVCAVVNGSTPKTGVTEYWDGPHQWITPAEMGKRSTPYIQKTARTLSDLGLQNSSATPLPPYSVILSSRAPIGHLVINTAPMATNQGCRGLVPSKQLAYKFLYHYLSSIVDLLNDLGIGATFKELSGGKLKEIKIPIPPLPEQQRIVAILDEAFEGIAIAKANAEKNLHNARALFESHLQAVFSERGEGWVEKTIGDVCDFLNGFAFKSEDAVPESETQLVRMGNLYGNKLSLDRNPAFYPDSFAEEYRRYILNEGDIIMSLTGTTGKEDYGYAVRVPGCEKSLLMNQRIVKFDSIKEELVNSVFLLHYLRSRVFLDILYTTANGTRQANLSSATIKSLPIPLCSIGEQKRIASSLESLREDTKRIESIYQQKLAALDALKKSLLDQAFSGQLVTK